MTTTQRIAGLLLAGSLVSFPAWADGLAPGAGLNPVMSSTRSAQSAAPAASMDELSISVPEEYNVPEPQCLDNAHLCKKEAREANERAQAARAKAMNEKNDMALQKEQEQQ